MVWDSEKIRYLRLRMGWSQSDLARRLNCDSILVSSWETGAGPLPLQEHLQILSMISNQAESEADQMLSCPLAEIMMDETRHEQITLESVKKRFSENN